jgi:carbonic anhydrase
MRKSIAVLLLSFSLSLGACGNNDDDGGGSRAAEWGYEGDLGPDHWADLSPDYATCGDGMEQSPIDIAGVTPVLEPELEPDYHSTPLVIFNNGHTIEVEYHDGSTLTVGDHTWEVQQFHLHARSEHTVDGIASPLELHIVHEDENGDLAVVGVLIEEGAENAALATVFDHLPAEEGEPEEIEGVEVNVADLLPDDLTAWRYDGSLTTPPCTEEVQWHVLATPIEASTEQIGAFEAIFDNNYRPVQPLNDRQINNSTVARAIGLWTRKQRRA